MSEFAPSILIVDDDEDACQNLSDILTDRGYEVSIAHGGVEALALVQRQTYDLALLDLSMPDMNGLELYRLISSVQARMMAMLVTANPELLQQREAIAAGFRCVIHKPVWVPRLIRMLLQVLPDPSNHVHHKELQLCISG